jgi:uncharacterized cupin superfamily protein
MPAPSITSPHFDQDRHAPAGFRALRALLARQAGAEGLGLSLWELPAGEAAYPYHFHLLDEELIVVLEGRPTLRTPAGWRELALGEVVSFPTGERGAHQLVNWSSATVRFLSFSTSGTPDVVLYPDSGKLAAAERRPDGYRLRIEIPEQTGVDYWQGEKPPHKPAL